MKRVLFSAAMFLCCVATTFAQFSGSGSGTENDPYLILNPIHLNQMRNFLNQEGVYFKLMTDIDLNEFIEDEYPSQGWLPVGTSSSPFKGILDGNGKCIRNLRIDRYSSDNIGLIAFAQNAKFKNITLFVRVQGKDNVGALVGSGSNIVFENCHLNGSIKGYNYVGGLLGVKTSNKTLELNNCHTNATIYGNDHCGGLVGGGTETHYIAYLDKCSSQTEIHGKTYVGGLVGGRGNFTNCFFQGKVYGDSYVGGLCGIDSYTVNCCYAISSIIASGVACCCGSIVARI